jgi:dye decolorizing peroxidase
VSQDSGIQAHRRALLTAWGAAAITSLAGCSDPNRLSSDPNLGKPDADYLVDPAESGFEPYGARQAGVASPTPRQAFQFTAVHSLRQLSGPHIRALFAALDREIARQRTQSAPGSLRNLSVTIGIGPDVVAVLDPTLPGAKELSSYPYEELSHRTGRADLLLNVCDDNPKVAKKCATQLATAVGNNLELVWAQASFRGQLITNSGVSASRNVAGFVDGLIGPHTSAQFDRHVWLTDPSPVRNGTIAVFRRMNFAVERFRKLSVAEQEDVFGRVKQSGAPLSGGTMATHPNLRTKTPSGLYLIPNESHVRRAHSLATGVGLMHRRSYSYTEPTAGLVFVSFQNTLATFELTMARMAEADAMLPYTTTTATGTFLILPGYSPTVPLGSTLIGEEA